MVVGPVLTMDRSGFCRVVVTQDWLSPTRAQSVKLPDTLPNCTRTVKLVLAPTASVPMVQVTVCPGPAVAAQVLLDDETYVSPAGRVSVTVSGPLAVAVPLLVTWIV